MEKMVNLHTYISPDGKMDEKHTKMIKVQIDNALQYWDRKDILWAANFDYEYNGVKTLRIPDLINSQYPENPRAIINSKVNVFIYLLENKILKDAAWYHDYDAFQLAPLDVKFEKDLGCVTYGIYPQWIFKYWGKGEGKLGENPTMTEFGFPRRINFGSVFFKPEALDIFKALLERMDRDKYYEEDAMTVMLEEGQYLDRVQIMNPTYNLGIRCLRDNIKIAEKPLKIAHFPPNQERWLAKFQHILPEYLKNRLNAEFTYMDSPR
jgi:hypothetical protein